MDEGLFQGREMESQKQGQFDWALSGSEKLLSHVAELFTRVIEFRDKHNYFPDETFKQACCLLADGKNSIEKELEDTHDIFKVKRIHDLAVRVEKLAVDITLTAERNLGECLNKLSQLGVPESVWTKKGGLSRLIEGCGESVKPDFNESRGF